MNGMSGIILPIDSKGVILMADDEAVVRSVIDRTLTHCGYHVLVASDGAEALELSRAFAGPIHLLLSDVEMPRLRGPELAEIVKRERPGMRILLMSGRSSGSVPDHWRAEFLRKPFLPKTLIRRIEECLVDFSTARCSAEAG